MKLREIIWSGHFLRIHLSTFSLSLTNTVGDSALRWAYHVLEGDDLLLEGLKDNDCTEKCRGQEGVR